MFSVSFICVDILHSNTPTCYILSPGRGAEVRRRSCPDITVDILEATLTPTNKMRIMYKSNLNFPRAR